MQINPGLSAQGVHLYYDLLFALSLALAGVYAFGWHKHFDVHITLVFVMVPVANLGYMMRAHASNLQEALAMNKIIYLGGCFLQLVILLAIFALCGIRLPVWLKACFFVLTTGAFFGALSAGQSDVFYRNVSFRMENGLPMLEREYGWMHTLFQGTVLLYLGLSLYALIYSFLKKKQISRKILVLLFLPQVVAILAFFGKNLLPGGLELTPAAYVIAEIMYLLIASRIPLYDVTDGAVESLVENGETGLISFDKGFHYLGSNERARKIFPGLRGLTVDGSIGKDPALQELVQPWMADFREDQQKNFHFYETGDQIYRVLVSWLYHHRKPRGYQLTAVDDTQQQKYIRLLNGFNTQLEEEVEAKTFHIQEMHDKLIMGMATMVESRDNSTGGHIRRTSEGVRILLQAMGEDSGFTPEERKKMIKAAPMHDLGKIAVPDKILQKPGKFEDWEYEMMKTHAAEGARIVRRILEGTDDPVFARIAENMAHYHHERWDGSGYPEKLQGEAIPREARVMAIADVYDALVSKRVYKDRMSFEEANRIMMEGMGSQFDPALEAVYVKARPALEAYYSGLAE